MSRPDDAPDALASEVSPGPTATPPTPMIAGRVGLSDLALDRPVMIGMILLAIFVLGAIAVRALPLAFLPASGSARVSIRFDLARTSPELVEREVIRPVEQQMAERLEERVSDCRLQFTFPNGPWPPGTIVRKLEGRPQPPPGERRREVDTDLSGECAPRGGLGGHAEFGAPWHKRVKDAYVSIEPRWQVPIDSRVRSSAGEFCFPRNLILDLNDAVVHRTPIAAQCPVTPW